MQNNLKNENIYNIYNYYISYKWVIPMKTIAVNEEIHQKISEFGHKNETYNQILERLYNSAIETQFAKLFLDLEDTVDVNDLEW
ncbi:hypothetical protein K9M74_00100 [Candidatus Woesearchaeota archaeon]|nr:hypothetical protein [Candidatus Woesearchaeota archaeon]